jgi:D-tagatose-bisphosphate aldolase class II non-catalytic subunit
MTGILGALAASRRSGKVSGIPSVCSAHPTVIEAALRRGRQDRTPVLIEATCNQVNQEGGYTGMTPADFANRVKAIAAKVDFDAADLILGGDHIGPNPWRKLPPEAALAKAEAMVAAYVAAGFSKIHLDASMGCAGEPEALDDERTAARAVRLARIAETTARESGLPPPVYIVGTEIPPPGGARHALDHIEPTSPDNALETIDVFRRAFAGAGLSEAFERVIALVVQPGVEFGHEAVFEYNPARARALSSVLNQEPTIVFEAHSTDYQPAHCLADLVRDGFCILKVGPGLTFAMREALYALDLIASEIDPDYPDRALRSSLEELMLAEPDWWRPYYPGNAGQQRLLRHYSYSDRIRYYWPEKAAVSAVDRLLTSLTSREIPVPLIHQFLPTFAETGMELQLERSPQTLVFAAIDRVLADYAAACRPEDGSP